MWSEYLKGNPGPIISNTIGLHLSKPASHAEIAKLYANPTPNLKEPAPASGRRGHMLLTNPIITIKGNTATAHLIWTGVLE